MEKLEQRVMQLVGSAEKSSSRQNIVQEIHKLIFEISALKSDWVSLSLSNQVSYLESERNKLAILFEKILQTKPEANSFSQVTKEIESFHSLRSDIVCTLEILELFVQIKGILKFLENCLTLRQFDQLAAHYSTFHHTKAKLEKYKDIFIFAQMLSNCENFVHKVGKMIFEEFSESSIMQVNGKKLEKGFFDLASQLKDGFDKNQLVEMLMTSIIKDYECNFRIDSSAFSSSNKKKSSPIRQIERRIDWFKIQSEKIEKNSCSVWNFSEEFGSRFVTFLEQDIIQFIEISFPSSESSYPQYVDFLNEISTSIETVIRKKFEFSLQIDDRYARPFLLLEQKKIKNFLSKSTFSHSNSKHCYMDEKITDLFRLFKSTLSHPIINILSDSSYPSLQKIFIDSVKKFMEDLSNSKKFSLTQKLNTVEYCLKMTTQLHGKFQSFLKISTDIDTSGSFEILLENMQETSCLLIKEILSGFETVLIKNFAPFKSIDWDSKTNFIQDCSCYATKCSDFVSFFLSQLKHGEVTYRHQDGDTWVFVQMSDGDMYAQFRLKGIIELSASDFIL